MANERKQVDWKALKRSLDTVTCIRTEHPACGRCFTEAQAYRWLSREIAETKEVISITSEFRARVKPLEKACDKHWIVFCYECSPLANIDKILARAKKRLASLKWQFVNLPSVAKALGRTRESVRVVLPPSAEVPMRSAPVEKLYGRERTGFETSKLRVSDIDDNIRLVEAWLRDKAQAA